MEKKLYRSSRQSVIAGVCGGLSEYFDIDVTIIRLAVVAAFLLGGTGLLLYIIAAIIIPKDTAGVSGSVVVDENGQETFVHHAQDSTTKNNTVLFVGLGFIVLGALSLVNHLFPYRNLWRQIRPLGFPTIVILIGIALMYSSFRKK